MTPDASALLTEQHGAVLTLTLNRPDSFNALDDALKVALIEALKAADRAADVRCVVLTGAGKAFCSGQDLKAETLESAQVGAALRNRYNKLARLLYTMEKPVVAAINGVAAGAGMGLALACDLRIMATSASFRLAFSNIGLIPDCGLTYTLPGLLPRGIALELAYTGRPVAAEEAQRLGLANRVVPDGELAQATAELAQALAARPTRALGLTKRAVNHAAQGDLDAALDYEAYLQQVAAASADFQEGLAAFREKRQPQFQGR